MNQHVRRRKAINKLVIFNPVNMMLLHLVFFRLRMTIGKCLRHSTNKKRAATARHIKNDRVLVNVANLCHEIRDVVRRKRLILVGLANVFIERDEEQVKQVLPRRTLIVNERENLVLDEIKNCAKILTIHITDILILENTLINQGQLLSLLQRPFKQVPQDSTNTADNLGSLHLSVIDKPIFNCQKASANKLRAELLADTVTVQQFVELIRIAHHLFFAVGVLRIKH